MSVEDPHAPPGLRGNRVVMRDEDDRVALIMQLVKDIHDLDGGF